MEREELKMRQIAEGGHAWTAHSEPRRAKNKPSPAPRQEVAVAPPLAPVTEELAGMQEESQAEDSEGWAMDVSEIEAVGRRDSLDEWDQDQDQDQDQGSGLETSSEATLFTSSLMEQDGAESVRGHEADSITVELNEHGAVMTPELDPAPDEDRRGRESNMGEGIQPSVTEIVPQEYPVEAEGGDGEEEEDPEMAALAAEISQGNDSVVLQ